MQKKNYRYLLLLITALACALRFTELGRESLRLDESMSFDVIARPLGDVARRLHTDPHPPVYFWVLRCWTALFGTTEAGLRSLSALLGTVSVPLTAVFVSSFLPPPAALGASLLLAVSPFHLYYSQDARPYALFGVLILISSHLSAEFLGKGGAVRLLGYCVAAILMIYTHIFGFFTALAHSAAAPSFLRGKAERMRQWILGQAVLLCGSIYWYRLYLEKRDSVPAQIDWLPLPRLADLIGLFHTFTLLDGVLGAFTLAMIAGGMLVVHADENIPMRRMILFGAVIPLAGAVGASYLVHPIFWPRYLLATFLCAQMYAGAALGWAWRRRLVRPALAIAVFFSSLAGVELFFKTTVNPQWREAAALFEHQAAPDAPILAFPGYYKAPIKYYLADNTRAYGLDPGQPLPPVFSSEPREVWVISLSGSASEPRKLLPSNYLLTEKLFFHRVVLLRFVLRLQDRTPSPVGPRFDTGRASH